MALIAVLCVLFHLAGKLDRNSVLIEVARRVDAGYELAACDACMHASTCVHVHACMHLHAYTCMHACIYMRTRACMHDLHAYTCMHACIYMRTRACAYACMHLHAYTCIILQKHLFFVVVVGIPRSSLLVGKRERDYFFNFFNFCL